MSKFINSRESVTSPLLLWQDVPTQVSVQETYDLKIWPVTNIYNDGPINFNLPPQPNGMLTSVDVVTKFSIHDSGAPITGGIQKNVSIINNFSNALWELVEIRLDGRIELMQSMRNAYAYQTFFNHALNTEIDHGDYLFQNEIFLMDQGIDKADAEDIHAIAMDSDRAIKKLTTTLLDTTDGADIDYAVELKKLLIDTDDLEIVSEKYGKNPSSLHTHYIKIPSHEHENSDLSRKKQR